MTILTLRHCLICYKYHEPGSTTFESVNLHETGRKNGEVCHRFCTLVSRYLPLATSMGDSHFQPEKTIKTKLTMSLTHVCDECFPVLATFCKMYDNWQRLQLKMNLKLEEISGLMKQADEINDKRYLARVPPVTDRRDLELKLERMGETMEEIHTFRNGFKVAVGLKARSTFPLLLFKRTTDSDDDGSEIGEADSEEEEDEDLFTPVKKLAKPAKKVLILLDEGFQSGIKTKKSADHCGSSKKWFKCPTCQLCLNDFQRMKNHVKLKHFGTWIELERNTSSTNSASSKDQQRDSHKDVKVQGKRKKSTWKSERFNKLEESHTCTRLSRHRHPDSEGEEVRVEEATPGADDNETVTEKGSRKRKRRNKTLSYYSIGLVHTSREKEKVSSSKESNVNRPYRCKYCISAFKNRHELAVHLRVHTGQRPFHCIFCPKSFTQITNLDNHVRSHIKEKPYKCKTCKKEFTQVTNLVFHERVHSNVKPYHCKVCGRKFAQISNWNVHQKSHK